jgi:long-chain acyl-CoA synthetase
LGDIWDKTALEYEDSPCMGIRQLLSGEEFQKDGKPFMHLEFGKYEFKTFSDVDDDISSVLAWFNDIGLKKADHVVIFAETRPEWMQTAIACFKYGLPGNI